MSEEFSLTTAIYMNKAPNMSVAYEARHGLGPTAYLALAIMFPGDF